MNNGDIINKNEIALADTLFETFMLHVDHITDNHIEAMLGCAIFMGYVAERIEEIVDECGGYESVLGNILVVFRDKLTKDFALKTVEDMYNSDLDLS